MYSLGCYFLLKVQTTLDVLWASQTGAGKALAEGVGCEMSPCLQHSSSQSTVRAILVCPGRAGWPAVLSQGTG